ncbi:MAG TPA: hypothetical protein VF184_09045 [Phycisphaeraceae bacterium]
MKSEQVLLGLLALAALVAGCDRARRGEAPPLEAPYAARQVWAVAPLRNESGSLQADGVVIADHLARQLENARPIDMVPVNRVLAAMDALEMPAVASPQDAQRLRRLLEVDGLIVGTVTAYEPYDPPKLGIAVELYLSPPDEPFPVLDVRRLSSAATDQWTQPDPPPGARSPASVVSGFYDAADPGVRGALEQYARYRGIRGQGAENPHLYRMSMDLYTEFVSYLVSSRLLQAESQRLAPPAGSDPTSP